MSSLGGSQGGPGLGNARPPGTLGLSSASHQNSSGAALHQQQQQQQHSSPNSGASGLQAMPSLLSPPPPHHQHQHHHQQSALQFDQAEHPAPPAMDELLDQMFALPSWADMGSTTTGAGNNAAATRGGASGGGGAGGVPWDFNAAAATRMGVDAQKLFTMSLLPGGLMGSHARDLQDASEDPVGAAHVGDAVLYGNDDNLLGATRIRGPPDNSSPAPGIGPRGSGGGGGGTNRTRSPSVGSSGSEGSGGPHSPPPIAPTWRQPYVGGVPPLPLGLGQAKPESLLRGDSGEAAHLLGKRSRDDDDVTMREAHSGNNLREGPQGLFATFAAGAQLTQTAMPRAAGQSSHQQGNGGSSHGLEAGQTVSVYGNQSIPPQAQSGPGVVAAAITPRPRVRARRGQATDPHSIAERLRRERIAERMKALQELVPNSNKTDKASMLDEIIDYVKFLQLQVKVLSMSRLGGAGAVAPLVADLPSEGPSNYVTATMNRSNGGPGPSQDGLALTERQVARLMEEDMGSAMQYLQSKGLCLMPISLATAISSTNSRSQGGNQGGGAGGGQMLGSADRQRSEPAATAAAAGSNNHNNAAAALTSGSPTAAVGGAGMESDAGNKSGSAAAAKNVMLIKDGRDVTGTEKPCGGSSSAKQSLKAKTQFATKGKEESQRRSQ